MNLEEFAERQRLYLTLVGATRADSLSEVSLKLFALRELVTRFEPGSEITREGLMAVTEELLLPLPESRVVELVRATGLLDDAGPERYRVRDRIALQDVFASAGRPPRAVAQLEEFRELFEGADASAVSVDPDDCVSAMRRTRDWATEIIAYCVDHGLRAVPVFWPCEGGRHRPLNRLGGSATTMDTLVLLGLGLAYGLDLSGSEALSPSTLESFVAGIAGLQCTDGGWNDGAFIISGDDQDFVNAYDPKLDRERGACPTVDASADALFALSLTRPWLRRSVSDEALDATLVEAARRTIGFLLRQQLADGGWALYRYEDDAHSLPAREVSSALVVEAMSAALEAGFVTDETVQHRIGSALDAAVDFALGAATTTEAGDVVWARDFGSVDATAETLVPTFWVGRLLLHFGATRAWMSLPERDDARTGIAGAASAIAREWEPDPDAFARLSFRVPTWRGPTATDFHWELPRDALIGSFLLQYATAAGSRLPERAWSKITNAVAAALDRELHGHWVDFEMKQRDGEDRALPGNTRYYNDLLGSYLTYLRSRLLSANLDAEGAS